MEKTYTVENLCPYLDNRAYNALINNEFVTVGQVETWLEALDNVEDDSSYEFKLKGIGKKSIDTIRQAVGIFRMKRAES